jgi:hypothetical protein
MLIIGLSLMQWMNQVKIKLLQIRLTIHLHVPCASASNGLQQHLGASVIIFISGGNR